MRRRGLARSSWLPILNSFAYYIALPALIISSFLILNWNDGNLLRMIGLQFFSILILVILLIAVMRVLRVQYQTIAGVLLVSTLGNTVYMGFPISYLAFGAGATSLFVGVAAAQLVASILIVLIALEYLLSARPSFLRIATHTIQNPLFISPFIGILFSFLPHSSHLFSFLFETTRLLGTSASPVALFALGIFLSSASLTRSSLTPSFFSTITKLIFAPLILYGLAMLFNFSLSDISLSVLIAAMPTAATSFVIADRYHLTNPFIANTIFLSTILSAITISAILFIF
jgi:predicted permease